MSGANQIEIVNWLILGNCKKLLYTYVPATANTKIQGIHSFSARGRFAARFITATPFKNQKAPVIEDIVWVSIFGVPEDLKSDQAKNMCKNLDIKKSQ